MDKRKLLTDIDTDCTVADFAEELAGYDFIDIEEHGTLYNDILLYVQRKLRLNKISENILMI
ncbi:MAG: hypothetical protein ACLVIP_04375 [Ruminococcus sp.]